MDNQDISRKIVQNLLAFHLGDSLRDSLGRQFKVMAEQLGGLQLQLGPQQEVVLEIKVHNNLKELKPEFLQ